MGINLSNKVSGDDVERLKDTRNPPEFESGFEESELDGGFSDLFDDLEFGDSSSDSSSSSGSSGGMSTGFNSGGSSGGMITGFNTTLNGGLNIGGINNQQNQAQQTKSAYDKMFDAAGESLAAIGEILVEAVKSIKLRTADDWGYFSNKTLKVSVIMIGASILLGLIGLIGNIGALKPLRLPLDLSLAGILTLGTGLVGLGAAALYIEFYGVGDANNVDIVPDIEQETDDSYDDDLESLLGDAFGEDELDGMFSDAEEEEDEDPFANLVPDKFEDEEPPKEKVDYNNQVDSVGANTPLMNREYLFNTLKSFFPINTPGFSDNKVIDSESDTFYTLETLCVKALASAGKMEFEDAAEKTHLETANETHFTYELRLKRIRGLTRLEDIEKEIVAYFRSSTDDTSVSCKADLEGDFYKLIINKGTNALITLGDLFSVEEVRNYILDTDKALPFIAGISEIGQPVLTDGKYYDTMLIAGKPRSGKSWYVLSILWTMMCFNTPEDVQFLIIDPKESNLFKVLSLMPHVCGLHDDINILKILRDVIDNEGARRKKLLADNRCENVWDLKKKGINIPILYIVIDEVMTVISNLSGNEKEFFSLMKVIVTQLPSQGIRLIMVPHRSQGVVDKTIRTNIGFTAAVRADTEVVCETLDIKKWTRPLLNPGDTALKMQGFGQEILVHGPAVTTTDSENTEHITSVARAFYKMGVEIPDMSNLGIGYNRDMEHIRSELELESNSSRVQFDLNDVSDVDLDNLE